MGDLTRFQRLKERFGLRMVKEEETFIEWDGETQAYSYKKADEITESDVTVATQLVCPTCRAKNYLKNGKCWQCDLGGRV